MVAAISRLRAWVRVTLIEPLVGVPVTLPVQLAERWPELRAVHWRRGGLPPRVGGWCLGQGSVQGITLWRTVFLAPAAPWEPSLLLHEHRHVEQFEDSAAFPILYIWESLTRGYSCNRFEADADAWAETRLRRPPPSILSLGA
jgi:hypothetical protein